MSTTTTPRQIQNQGQVSTGLARLAALMVVVACLAVGAGCSRGSATSSYSPTWTPPATTTATASATPTLSPEQAAARATALAMEPPQPEDDMNDNSPLGATKAATYFLQLVPYIGATGDLDVWVTMSSEGCEFCNGVATDASSMHELGGWTDPWEQEITALGYLVAEDDPNRYVIRTQVICDGYTEHPSPSEPPRQVEEFNRTLFIQLYWKGDKWTIEALQIDKDSK